VEVALAPIEKPWAVIVAGLLGSVISLSFIDEMNKRQRCVAVLSGIAMAHYLSSYVADMFSHGKFEETIGFLIGLFGMSVCGSMFRAIKNADLWNLIKERFKPYYTRCI